ncbi:MAG TPA: glycosyltransferase, partial [Kribbella sp.]
RPLAEEAPQGFIPTWCGQWEASNSTLGEAVLPISSMPDYLRARLLVRFHGEPLGFLELDVPGGVLDEGMTAARVEKDFGDLINQHRRRDEQLYGDVSLDDSLLTDAVAPVCARSTAQTSVTVAVCTRNRPETLRSCLAELQSLVYPHLEILIVDNAPSDDGTEQVVRAAMTANPRIRYVREPRPGLSCARNRAIIEAKGEVLAFTDDDVAVDPLWVDGLVDAFRTADTWCVTGLVPTAILDGPFEGYFDARVNWGDRCDSRRYDLGSSRVEDALYPFSAGIFGTGANFACRTQVLRDLRGFDEALGAGTLTAGGEDLDIFVRILFAGGAIQYEPRAIVWHKHRADLANLEQQMYSHGTGMSAFLSKQLADPKHRWALLSRVPTGARKLAVAMRSTKTTLGWADQLAPGLLRKELRGMAAGPLLYRRARRRIPPRHR